MNKEDMVTMYKRFKKWCEDNPHLDLDPRLHSHSGPIGYGGYISHEKTAVAFAAWRAALEAAREDACVALVADIRFACGDNGKRMQPELVEYIRGLARDAARYRWLRKGESDDVAVVRGLGAMDYGMSAVVYTYSEEIDGDDLDAAIDQARGEGVA